MRQRCDIQWHLKKSSAQLDVPLPRTSSENRLSQKGPRGNLILTKIVKKGKITIQYLDEKSTEFENFCALDYLLNLA